MTEELLAGILGQLVRIGDALESIARSGEPAEPNLVKPLEEYSGFDWAALNATIVHQDQDGPTHVEWSGNLWTRRSPANKFDPAIWFSRAAGKDAEGNVKYLRLITFRKIGAAEPVPEKAKQKAAQNPSNKASPSKKPAESAAGNNVPDQKAWDAWHDLVDKAKVLGIDPPWPKTGISMAGLRAEYGKLQAKVKEAESQIPAGQQT